MSEPIETSDVDHTDASARAAPWPTLSRVSSALFWPAWPFCLVLNRLIDSESWAQDTLAPFVGRKIELVLKPITIGLLIDEKKHFTRADDQQATDLTIEVQRADVAAIALSPERAQSLVAITGDTELAQALALLGRHLRPDLEEQLARVFGNVLAVRMAAGLNAFVAAVLDGHRRVAENLAEYLLEERPQLVRPRAVAELSAEVRILRDDLARLEKRIERLSSPSDAAA